ncbi:MAG TPA: hypothetical protein VMI32_18290 [Candidatus Solibacter sp.]|nr:hypothetical protein [Candidatus Solibacter sp.]
MSLGLAAILADLAFLASTLTRLFEASRLGLLGLVPSLGLSLLHAAGAVALHQVDYFSLISRILVLFSSLVAIVIGAVLLKTQPAAPPEQNRAALPVPHKGDR